MVFQFPYDPHDERDDELRPPRGRWRCRGVVARRVPKVHGKPRDDADLRSMILGWQRILDVTQ